MKSKMLNARFPIMQLITASLPGTCPCLSNALPYLRHRLWNKYLFWIFLHSYQKYVILITLWKTKTWCVNVFSSGLVFLCVRARVCVYWAVMMAVSPEPSCGHFALVPLSHQPSSLPTSCSEYCSLDLSHTHTHTQTHTHSQCCQSLRMCVYISQHLWQQQPSGHSASSPKHLHAGTNNFQSSSERASTYPSLLWRS